MAMTKTTWKVCHEHYNAINNDIEYILGLGCSVDGIPPEYDTISLYALSSHNGKMDFLIVRKHAEIVIHTETELQNALLILKYDTKIYRETTEIYQDQIS
jgi:hypothetical protein